MSLGGPGLDIERGNEDIMSHYWSFFSSVYLALNKLEKVALRCSRRTGKPLVLVFNNVHYFKNDENGHSMLLQVRYQFGLNTAWE